MQRALQSCDGERSQPDLRLAPGIAESTEFVVQNSRRMTFGRYDYASFLTLAAYAAGSVVIPVSLVELAQELGFSLTQQGGMTAGGVLHLGRTVPMVAAMLLVGFAAGHWGTRRVLGFSTILMGLGMAFCAMAPVYGILLLALMLAGLGEGVIEGLATPFVQALHPNEPGRYINFTHAFWSVGVLVTVLGSGVLLTLGVSWRVLVGAVSIAGGVAGVMILLPARRGTRYPDATERTHWRHIWGHAVVIVREPRFWLYYAAMFLAGGGEFCLTFWSASHIQLQYGTSPWSGGLGVALFATGMVIGRTGWGYLIHQKGLRRLIVFSALGGTVLCLFLPTAAGLWLFLVLLFGAGIATAPFWPSIQSYATDRLPHSDTTMLLILLSCAGVPGCGFFTYLMGYLGDTLGNLSAAFYLVPFSYAALAVLVAFDWLILARSKDRTQRPRHQR